MANQKYPKKGKDFPRRDILITPQDELYNPNKILGGKYGKASLTDSGETILYGPRLESTRLEHTQENVLPSSIVVNQPFDTTRRQDHLDPSRYAECFYMTQTTSLPAAVFPPAPTTIITFDTIPTMRTIIRWIEFINFDGLTPSGITVGINLQGQPVKYLAQMQRPTASPVGFPPSGTATSVTDDNLDNLPLDFHNMLLEVGDRQNVEVTGINTLPAVRKVQASIWGWIEPITRLSESVHK